jgi:hypothetical protein
MAGLVYAHMGNGKTVHLVKAGAFDGEVLVSSLALCGLPYLGGQKLSAVTCKRCLSMAAAKKMAQ